MTDGLTYKMTITEVSKNNQGYVVKAEIEESIYNHNQVRFVVPKDCVKYFPLGEDVTIDINFGRPLLTTQS